jgi:hypothetical protein
VTIAATYDQLMSAPRMSNDRLPHGTASERNWILTASIENTRRTISRPSVMTATENNGSPTIGRIARRSMTSPSTAATPSATTTHSSHASHFGSMLASGFLIVVNGMCSSTIRNDRNNAPAIPNAPCEKLTVRVALKTSTNPRAMIAYTDPRASAFINVSKKTVGS